MTGKLKVAVGIAVIAMWMGSMASFAWADGQGRGGHEYGMQRHGHGSHGGTQHLLHSLLKHQKEIGLTDEQVGKLKGLALDQDRARIRVHADAMIAERELRALAWDEKADLSAIEAKIKESQALSGTLRFMRIKAKRDLLAVLTPEQQDKLKAAREHRRTAREDWMAFMGQDVALLDDEGITTILEAESEGPEDGRQAG